MEQKIPNIGNIPVIGYGTAEFPFCEDEEAVKISVLNAIEIGYRHFDTAALYWSEKPLGEAIAEALRLGLIKSRDEVFITSNLFMADAHSHLVFSALHQTLKNLGLEYIDLYLIHFPVSLKEGTTFPFGAEDIVEMDMGGVWKAMEECQVLGLTKAIGISNFTCAKILNLLAFPSAVNQVEMNPCWQQKKLKKLCEEKRIHITAYSPLGGKGTPWGTNQVLDSQVLKEIANARGKTVAQVCMRWAYEQNVSIVVKSSKKERMREDLEIFDWELSEDDLKKIDQIPQERGSKAENFVTDKGHYKSRTEVWDGEL